MYFSYIYIVMQLFYKSIIQIMKHWYIFNIFNIWIIQNPHTKSNETFTCKHTSLELWELSLNWNFFLSKTCKTLGKTLNSPLAVNLIQCSQMCHRNQQECGKLWYKYPWKTWKILNKHIEINKIFNRLSDD